MQWSKGPRVEIPTPPPKALGVGRCPKRPGGEGALSLGLELEVVSSVDCQPCAPADGYSGAFHVPLFVHIDNQNTGWGACPLTPRTLDGVHVH